MLALFPERTIVATIGSFTIYWYGLLYLIGFGVAYLLLPKLQRQRGLSLNTDQWLALVVAGMAGVLLGGRLGYVFFYEPGYFMQHPAEIIQFWRGGMSFHGGLAGTALALWLAARRYRIDPWRLFDVVVVPAALGLALGRLGNFINQELYGTVTSLPWGIAIPEVSGLRHPVQLYAVVKNLLIAGICAWYLYRVRPVIAGRATAMFLLLYGFGRLFISPWREYDGAVWYILSLPVTAGQLLTVFVLLLGTFLWWKTKFWHQKALSRKP